MHDQYLARYKVLKVNIAGLKTSFGNHSSIRQAVMGKILFKSILKIQNKILFKSILKILSQNTF